MKNLKMFLVLVPFLIFSFSCTSSRKTEIDDDFATDSGSELSFDEDSGSSRSNSKSSVAANDNSDLSLDDAPSKGGKDEFDEFDSAPAGKSSQAQASSSSEDDLEKELSQLENNSPTQKTANGSPNDLELDLDNNQNQAAPPPVAEMAPPPAVVPSENPQPVQPEPSQPSRLSQINSVRYQANANGGALVIDADAPMQFTTRLNSATNQLIVEVQNAVIPQKLKRNLNTKDMASSIGSVDIYQKANSKVSRFVVQLRPGSPEPLVQPEGNSLIIVGASADGRPKSPDSGSGGLATNGGAGAGTGTPTDGLGEEGILTSQGLEDFLANNNKFYGKKISLEANKLDLGEAFRFLSEESGINMIVDEAVKGEITIKLRQVPWDQALVMILKAKGLAYKRQGTILRISTVDQLVREEQKAIELVEARRSTEPLVVRRFFIGYADIKSMEEKIKSFLTSTSQTRAAGGAAVQATSRGSVLSDSRTSSLIVTDTAANISKIEKLIQALDTQPRQVLIEGKVVEAQEKFTRGLGVDWATGARDLPTGDGIIQPSTTFNGTEFGSGNFTAKIGVGKLDAIGSLDAKISLGERESKVRVLSAPRISVLSGESASIKQTVTIQVPTTTSSTGGTSTTSYSSTSAGVSLNVKPQASSEGTVVMDLQIERSFPAEANGSNVESRNANTKVIVKSGQTAVIGGIFQADAVETSGGIPFLRNIPVLGYAFGGRSTIKGKNELVIFVTPKIQRFLEIDRAAAATAEKGNDLR